MSAVKPIELLTPEQYLEGEAQARHKHEYVAGQAYMMAGASSTHSRMSTAFAGAMVRRLRGKPCEPFDSDMKLRIERPFDTRFYYPDGMVVCDPRPTGVWQDKPVVLLEVISPSSRRIDCGEKLQAYLTIPTLDAYLLAEMSEPKVTVYQRNASGVFVAGVYEGLDATIPLPAIACELPLAELYERVDFAAARRDDEADGERD
jgi:Uma2 family endonuclease